MIAGQLGQDCAGPVQLGPVARADLKDLLTNFRLQFLGGAVADDLAVVDDGAMQPASWSASSNY